MPVYRLEGRLTASLEEPERVWSTDANTASDAMNRVAAEAANSELNCDRPMMRHFTLLMNTDKGEKIVLTVCGYGRGWSESLKEAYERVCYWQGQEPNEITIKMPDQPQVNEKGSQLTLFGDETLRDEPKKRGRKKKAFLGATDV